MTGAGFVLLTTFLVSSVEAIEMVTIVVGVGATRGRRATLIVAFIVVSFGAGANQLAVAVIGGVGAVALVGAIGATADPDLRLPQASIRG